MNRTRQLAAIMFTDIQGYTRMMQKDEQKAIQFREKHRRIFNSLTNKYNGIILQYYGDGTLSIFSSAIDAVLCAIEMQNGFGGDPAIPVRIGIHTGDIIYSEEEIIGDGVNIAARIESLALAGSILVSDKVYDEIKNQNDIKTSHLKTVQLKNVERAVAVYAIANEGLVIPQPSDLQGKTEDPFTPSIEKALTQKNSIFKNRVFLSAAIVIVIMLILYLQFFTGTGDKTEIADKSIAVLPFVNMSNDPEQEYFSDGISEEILNTLAKIPQLKVAGRTSAFSFKGKNEDIRTIGQKLNVKMVLEGSVRKAGNQMRITAQLLNVDDGFHLWSETYDKDIEDVFAVQEDIARRIGEKLRLQIRESIPKKSKPQNMEAYEMFLKGSFFFKRGALVTEKAMQYFQKAVELDPDYAEAWAYIGETYLHFAGYNLISTADGYAKARNAAEKAIELNPFEARAHKVLAYVNLFFDWNWQAAQQEYEKAISFGLSEQNEFITYYYIFLKGDFDRAIQISKEMLETDPLHVVNHFQLGVCYYFAQRFEEALQTFNNAIELEPSYSDGYQWKGLVLAYLGKYEQAVPVMEKALELSQGRGLAKLDMLAVKILMGKKEEALQEIKAGEYIDAMDAARLYAMLKMPDKASTWLEKGYRQHSVMMVTLKNFWVWDPLRNDPRFIEIYKRMNFPE